MCPESQPLRLRQISLSEMLPTSGVSPWENSLVVLKSYFDGGNQDVSSEYEFVSLAAISGKNTEWIAFERDWRKLLNKHEVAYLHTTDLLTGNDIYEGWTEQQRKAFLTDCVKVAGKHLLYASRDGKPGRNGLLPCVVTVNLKDFIKGRAENPAMPVNANEILIRQVMWYVFEWGNTAVSASEYHLYFDQGEPFYGYLCNMMTNRKALKHADILTLVASRTEADMRRVPGLQLADLFAWCVSHRTVEPKPRWHERILRLDRVDQLIDNASMGAFSLQAQEVWKSWKIPPRRATR